MTVILKCLHILLSCVISNLSSSYILLMYSCKLLLLQEWAYTPTCTQLQLVITFKQLSLKAFYLPQKGKSGRSRRKLSLSRVLKQNVLWPRRKIWMAVLSLLGGTHRRAPFFNDQNKWPLEITRWSFRPNSIKWQRLTEAFCAFGKTLCNLSHFLGQLYFCHPTF